MLGQWVVRPSDPAYYIEDSRIYMWIKYIPLQQYDYTQSLSSSGTSNTKLLQQPVLSLEDVTDVSSR